MTQLLETLRNRILTSLYGRRLGLDKDEFIQGPKAFRSSNQTLTSGTTATAVTNYGQTEFLITTAAASTASSVGTTEIGMSWVMDAPAEGVRKMLSIACTGTTASTAGVVVEFGSGVTGYKSSLGSTFTGIKMDGTGAWIELVGVSTAKWMALGMSTSTSMASSN